MKAPKRFLADKLARLFISTGGVAIIAVVIAIFVFIAYETLPLWKSASVELRSEFVLPDSVGRPLSIGLEEYQRVGYAVTDRGKLVTFDLQTGRIRKDARGAPSEVVQVTATAIDLIHHTIAIGNSLGVIEIWQIRFGSSDEGKDQHEAFDRITRVEIPDARRIEEISLRSVDAHSFILMVVSQAARPDTSRQVHFYSYKQRTNRITGDRELEVALAKLETEYPGTITAVAVDALTRRGIVGTSAGKVFYWSFTDPAGPVMVEAVPVLPELVGVASVEFLLGGITLIVGGTEGSVRSWTFVGDADSPSGWTLIPLNTFTPGWGKITSIAASARNKAFLTTDDGGHLFLHHQTTGKTNFSRKVSSTGLTASIFAPRANGIVSLSEDGHIAVRSLHHPHGEVSLGVLFGKVHYEGYSESSFTWQSSSGTDDSEPKYSIVPLLFGTLKGAFYALIFAIPLAILAAIYTALFAHPSIKTLVKPTVEIMAALPSVVIGFIAALWLAPLMERVIAEILLATFLLPLMVLLVALVWGWLPRWLTGKLRFGSELFIIVAGLLALIYLSFTFGPSIEQLLFGTSLRQWLVDSFGVSYDQRNSIVVGFAMGFAVIPIIFTISEDALSGVPEHLTAGSLALGASRWQTAVRVVLPTASPGIFSAAMVGFGRAVGETMIVLMATGNTPIMNLSPFLGMRTLSANIAVELPEAPHLGTLYRVLFFSGLLLFFFTFTVNTVAELVRQRLRKQYSTI